MEDAFIECRDLGHNWKWTNDKHIVYSARKVPIQMTRVILCPRCTTTVDMVMEIPSMEVVKRTPHYPPGYLATHGKVTKQEARQEMLRRVFR